MRDRNAAWFGRVDPIVPDVVRRGFYPLVVLTGGCCVGALAGMVGAVVGAIGGIAAAATWLKRHGYLDTRGQARNDEPNRAEHRTDAER